MAEELAYMYINCTHGSLPNIDFDELKLGIAANFCLKQEEANLGWDEFKKSFEGWASIVQGQSWVTIYSVVDAGHGTALAHWETNYDVKPDGSHYETFHGTKIDISGKKMRGFMCFASFRIDMRSNKIVEIIQRSDDVVRKFGIEGAAYR